MRKAARKQKKLDKLREEENQKVEINANIIAAQDRKELRVSLSKETDLGSLHEKLLEFPAKHIGLFSESLLTNSTLEHLQLECDINLVQQVIEALKVNTSVKSLFLFKLYSGYNGTGIDPIFPLLGSLLIHTTSLTNLQLPTDLNYVTSDGFGDFIKGLKDNHSLTRINIPAYHYQLDHMSAFLKAIEDHPKSPKAVITTHWTVSTEVMKSVGLLLEKNLMKEFNLEHREEISTDAMVPMFQALKGNSSLTHFSYTSRALRKKECETLAEALIVNKHLTKLNLKGSSIGSESMSIILDSLCRNTTVVDFTFWDTELDNNVAPALARLIQFNETLTEIDLPLSQINAEGCKFIGPALRDNRSITSLRLLMNPIGSEGVKHLCEGLKWNKALIRVNLSDCQIDDIGCSYIGEAIKTNQCLLHLDISGTPIKEKGYKSLIEGMKENQSLTDLTLSKDRTVSNDIHEEIYKSQNKNKEYQQHLKVNTIILLIQIARSDTFALFPLEIWLRIFKHFVCGGVPGFNHIAETLLMNSDVRDLSSLCKMKIVRINGKSHLVPSKPANK